MGMKYLQVFRIHDEKCSLSRTHYDFGDFGKLRFVERFKSWENCRYLEAYWQVEGNLVGGEEGEERAL